MTARERHKIFLATIRTTDTGESLLEVTALEEFVYRPTDDAPPKSVLFLILLRIYPLEHVEMERSR